MNREERSNIIRGNVRLNHQWVSLERAQTEERRRNERIGRGLVLCQGDWVSIDEKLRRCAPVVPAESPQQGASEPQPIIVNQHITNQTYTITNDNRVSSQHRHVHLDILGSSPRANSTDLRAIRQIDSLIPPEIPESPRADTSPARKSLPPSDISPGDQERFLD